MNRSRTTHNAVQNLHTRRYLNYDVNSRKKKAHQDASTATENENWQQKEMIFVYARTTLGHFITGNSGVEVHRLSIMT